MHRRESRAAQVAAALLLVVSLAALRAAAQQPVSQERPAAEQARVDAAAVERGRDIYRPNCAFCHGLDTRGAAGPDLARSLVILNDENGRELGEFLKVGRPDRGMPAFGSLLASESANLAVYLHATIAEARRRSPVNPAAIVVGDSKAGEAYFNGAGGCSRCHSPAGDLKGVGGRYDPMVLQGRMVNPRGRGGVKPPPPITARVTLASRETAAGRLVSISDFFVTIVDEAGNRRTFPLDNGMPKVEITDPLQAHLDMLLKYTDTNMHNLTAYLVTLK
jgi:cytochrome c oxidase cbb3-type subunit III